MSVLRTGSCLRRTAVAAALATLATAAIGCSESSTLSSAPATKDDLAEVRPPAEAPDDAEPADGDTAAGPSTGIDPADDREGGDPGDGDAADAAAPPTPPTPADLDTAPLPGTPGELAPALTEAELALRRDDAVTGADAQELTRAWGRRQQLLYRVLAANPHWADQVLADVDPEVAPAVEANWHAQTELTALVRTYTLSPTVPAWRIKEPPPADELLAHYHDAANETGVPWEILAAIHLIETRMGRIEGVSTAGAVGPMQFLPSTWEECCEGDPTVPADAIRGAATYLVRRGAPGDLDQALKGYNTSDHYARAVKDYAAVMTEDPETYHAYYAWEVHFLSAAGLVHLPVGYEEQEPVDASIWVADHPDDLLPQPPTS